MADRPGLPWLQEAWSPEARAGAAKSRRLHLSANGHQLKVGDHVDTGVLKGRIEKLTHAIDGTPQVTVAKGDGTRHGTAAGEVHKLSVETKGGLTKIGDRLPPPGPGVLKSMTGAERQQAQEQHEKLKAEKARRQPRGRRSSGVKTR